MFKLFESSSEMCRTVTSWCIAEAGIRAGVPPIDVPQVAARSAKMARELQGLFYRSESLAIDFLFHHYYLLTDEIVERTSPVVRGVWRSLSLVRNKLHQTQRISKRPIRHFLVLLYASWGSIPSSMEDAARVLATSEFLGSGAV